MRNLFLSKVNYMRKKNCHHFRAINVCVRETRKPWPGFLIYVMIMIFLLCVSVIIFGLWVYKRLKERCYIDPETGKDLRELGYLLYTVESEFGEYKEGDVVVVNPRYLDLKIGDVVYIILPGHSPFWIINGIDRGTGRLSLLNGTSRLTQFSRDYIKGKVIGKA